LVIPDLIGRLFKYVLSAKAMYYYWVSLPLYPVYAKWDLRSNRKVTPHQAENQLLPAAMQTEFDYSNNICIASTAFLLLFFGTKYAYWTCWILVGWVVFSYVSLKICHLRYNMLVEYTSYLMDDAAMYLWSIPLSMLAAVSAYWATLSLKLAWWIPYLAFCMSMLTYLGLLAVVYRLVTPFDFGGKGDFNAARKRLRYDYFNTNPIMVLKSRYLRQSPPLTYFVRGKEYLQQSYTEMMWNSGEEYLGGSKSYFDQSWKSAQASWAKLFPYETDADSDGEVGCVKGARRNLSCCAGST